MQSCGGGGGAVEEGAGQRSGQGGVARGAGAARARGGRLSRARARSHPRCATALAVHACDRVPRPPQTHGWPRWRQSQRRPLRTGSPGRSGRPLLLSAGGGRTAGWTKRQVAPYCRGQAAGRVRPSERRIAASGQAAGARSRARRSRVEGAAQQLWRRSRRRCQVAGRDGGCGSPHTCRYACRTSTVAHRPRAGAQALAPDHEHHRAAREKIQHSALALPPVALEGHPPPHAASPRPAWGLSSLSRGRCA